MHDMDWRKRLTEALDKGGHSMRSVSLAAGCGQNYLYSILVEGREPSIDKTMAVADALGISLSWLLYGYEMGKQEEQLLRLYAQLPAKQRQILLDLAAGLVSKD